jgi:hypothetical protein
MIPSRYFAVMLQELLHGGGCARTVVMHILKWFRARHTSSDSRVIADQ